MSESLSMRYRVPAGLACVGLMFWGLVAGHIVAAVLMAVVLEARRAVRVRWELDDGLISRIWALCVALSLVLFVIGLMREGVARAAYFAIEWAPVALLPLVLAQVYGTREGIPVRILSMLGRFMESRGGLSSGGVRGTGRVLNVEYPYLCAVITAAAATKPAGLLFYFGSAVLIVSGLLLRGERPRQNPVVLAVAVLGAMGLGYAGHVGLHGLHVQLENWAVGLNMEGPSSSVNRSVTRLGAIGELKLSKRVDWWVKPVEGVAPGLLRRASFDTYRREMWVATVGRNLVPVRRQMVGGEPVWAIDAAAGAGSNSVLGLVGLRHGGETQLPLPAAPQVLAGLAAEEVSRSGLGLTVAAETPLVLDFQVGYRADANTDLPAGDGDLVVPKNLEACLKRVLDALGAGGKEPRALVAGLTGYFAKNFQYSTRLEAGGGDGDPVQEFLEVRRRGHCEYFATSTVLLLRRAGIPARYVTGYVLQEYDKRRNRFAVRGLHAHAWAQVWLDGRWEFVDTTPGSWVQSGQEALSVWQPLRDWFQGVPMAWAAWMKAPAGRRVLAFLKWGSLPLLGFYLWLRLFRGRRGRLVHEAAGDVRIERQGKDSEWYVLEPVLAAKVGWRAAGEPLFLWWSRVGPGCPGQLMASVGEVLELHCRLRFDTEPLPRRQRERLRSLALDVKAELESEMSQATTEGGAS